MIRSTGLRTGLLFTVTAMLSLALTAPAAGAPSYDAPSYDDVSVAPALPFPVPPSPPEFDSAFYAPPAKSYATKSPGEIIAARQVNVANFSVIPLNVDAWQLSYRSTDTRGEPVAAVTTVLKPRGGSAGAGGKLLSVQIAEDSLAQYCAPSYAMQLASIPTVITGSAVVSAEFFLVQAALAQGWVVAVPDYQGPKSAYAAGPLHARLTLDGIRAAERFESLHLPGSATQVALSGYSGGAIATVHSAELQPTYAPEINLVGAAAGGVPADLGVVLNNANNALPSGLIFGAVIGLTREYHDFADFIDEHMDPLGRALINIKNPLCTTYQAASFPFANLKAMIRVPGDPLDHPTVKSVIDRTRLGKATPKAPMYLYQSNPDWIVPVGQVTTLVDTYCEDPSARVQYTRDHFSEHLSLGFIGATSAIGWLRDRLDGKPVAPGCSTFDAGSMALDQSTWGTLGFTLGELAAGIAGKPIGT